MKAMVIGLDGATFRILDPLMEAGFMPSLEEAMGKGARGELLSTIPPVTALAWPSFFTGKNAGKHGLLGWQERLNEEFKRPWISARKIDGPKLWHILNQEGFRTCVVNVPVTYPPEPLDGVMVSGMLTPGLQSEFTYPPDLREALLAAVPGYQIDVDVQHTARNSEDPNAVSRLLSEALAATRARGEGIRWLLEREDPDMAAVVFEMPDRLQHVLWRYIESLPASSAGSADGPALQAELLDCYQALDEQIGFLTDRLSREAYLILMSDHGFGVLETLVHINEWLAARGWLAYDRYRTGGREILRRVGRFLEPWLPSSIMQRGRQTLPKLGTLDWARTQAYAGLPSEYGIFLNLQGREPAGIVKEADYADLRDRIIEALREWRDPRQDKTIMKRVYRREEIYHGPYVAAAPDIVFELQPGYKVSHLPFQGDLVQDVSHQPHGFHEREGIFAISGPGIPSETKIAGSAIEDVMPTLLYALGLPIPDDLDGRVLREAFTGAWTSDHPVRYRSALQGEGVGEPRHQYSPEDEAAIAEHLKGLGYLE